MDEKIVGVNLDLWNLDLYVECERLGDLAIVVHSVYVTDSIDIVGVLNEAQLTEVREALEGSITDFVCEEGYHND